MQDIELGKKIDELFQARWVVNGWGVNGDGCTDLLLLFCCLLIRPAVLELIRTWWRIGVLKKDSRSSFKTTSLFTTTTRASMHGLVTHE